MIQSIYPAVRKFALNALKLFSQKLPYWKDAPSKEIVPPLLSIPVSRPLNYQHLPGDFARHFIAKKSIPARRIFFLKDVYVSGQAIVFKNCRIFVPSLTWLRDADLFRSAELFIKSWTQKIPLIPANTPAALVYDDWSAANYYHWMIEALPKLLLVDAEHPGAVIIVPGPTPEFIKTSIQLMGFTNLHYLTRHWAEEVKVSRLLLPELVYYEEEDQAVLQARSGQTEATSGSRSGDSPGFNPSEELILAVRRKLLERFENMLPVPTRRVYISRANQKIRRLVNEVELLPVLEEFGFEVCYFEGMTLIEQMQLMLQTQIFVSLHGSNMVNILFMQQGCQVVELMNQDYVNDAYYLLASSLKLPYYSMPCTMIKETGETVDRVALNDADVTVDVQALEKLLVSAISPATSTQKGG